MILVKSDDISKRHRDIKTVNVVIDEKPQRPDPHPKTDKDMVKFVKSVETIVRSSLEYKDCIKYIRDHLDGKRCACLQNISNTDGKRYSIEIHHEPFNLFQIVYIVTAKYQALGKPLNKLEIANEVTKLHYTNNVGLIPLSATQHQLVHRGDIFIPFQQIYQDYVGFVQMYGEWIDPKIEEAINFKAEMSEKCDGRIQSNILKPEFVYIECDGFKFPKVPDDWIDKKRTFDSVLEEAIANENADESSNFTEA